MADANELIIRMKLDRSLAEREAEAFHKAEKARIVRTLSDAEVAEKARTAFIRRENAQRVQEAARATRTAVERAREEARERIRAEREAEAERRRLLREAEKAARDAARERLRAERDAEAERRRLLRESVAAQREAARQRAREEREEERRRKSWTDRLLSDEEIAERAKTEVIRRENRQRMHALADSAGREKGFVVDLKRVWADKAASIATTGGAISAAASLLTSFGAQMVGLSSASAVFGEVVAGFQRVRDSVFQSTELLHDFRETLLELATLRDRMGDTSGTAADVLRIQAASGQHRQDVVALQSGILGVAESAVRGGRIDQAGVERVAGGVGRIQAVMGGDASAFGYLAGQLLNQMPTGPGGTLDPDAVVREFAAMQALAQPGGPGFSSLARQYAKASGFVGNGIATPREAMGVISALSISEGEEAGTRFQQLIRATVGSMGRNRKVTLAEGDEAIGTADYLKSLGATPAMNFVDVARRITADVDRAQAEATRAGREFNPISYLQSRGYGNEESVNSLLTMGNLIRSGTFDATFGGVIADPNAGAGVVDEATRRLASDPGLQARQTKAAVDAANMAVGSGQTEVMTNVRRAAYARLRSRPGGERMSSFEDIERSSWFGPTNLVWGEKSGVHDEAARMVIEAARANGVPMRTYAVARGGGCMGAGGMAGEAADDAEVFRAAQALASRGVNFGAEAGSEAVDVLRRNLAALEEIAANTRPAAAAAPAGRPRQPAARP